MECKHEEYDEATYWDEDESYTIKICKQCGKEKI